MPPQSDAKAETEIHVVLVCVAAQLDHEKTYCTFCFVFCFLSFFSVTKESKGFFEAAVRCIFVL